MQAEQSDSLICVESNYNPSFSAEDMTPTIAKLKQQAINDGFVLSSYTGKKTNALRFQCHRSKLPRETKGDGKRSKPSKKIGNIISNEYLM